MKIRSLPFLFAILALLTAGPGCAVEQRLDLLGQAAAPAAAARTIVITPSTRHVNVEGGEIVRFVVGDKDFAWHFNGPLAVSAFDLNRVTPPGMLDHRVTAYISPNLDYVGGAAMPGF